MYTLGPARMQERHEGPVAFVQMPDARAHGDNAAHSFRAHDGRQPRPIAVAAGNHQQIVLIDRRGLDRDSPLRRPTARQRRGTSTTLTTSAGLPNASIWIAFIAGPSGVKRRPLGSPRSRESSPQPSAACAAAAYWSATCARWASPRPKETFSRRLVERDQEIIGRDARCNHCIVQGFQQSQSLFLGATRNKRDLQYNQIIGIV